MQPDEVDHVYRTPRWLRRLTARQIVGALAIAAFAWVSAPLWLKYFPDSLVYFRELGEARTAIGRIDEIRRTHGGFPSDLCQVGLPCVEDARLGYNLQGNGYV